MNEPHPINTIGGGLRPLKKDSRDFNLHPIFGQIPLGYLPDTDFVVAEPLKIKDQQQSDMCTAFAIAAVSEDQEGVELSPEWIFSRIKKIEGDIREWGANPRDACKAVVDYGSIEQKDAPYTLAEKTRDFLADYKNWPNDLTFPALKHRKKSYFRCDTGGFDMFDNLRGALWQNKDTKSTVFTGCLWRPEWTPAIGGIIPKEYNNLVGFGHAFKLFGQKKINGEIHLVAQLSNSEKIGDAGRYYFTREIVNREFTFGSFILIDADAAAIKSEYWPWWVKVVDWFRKLLHI